MAKSNFIEQINNEIDNIEGLKTDLVVSGIDTGSAIVYVKCDFLTEHERQAEIYGETTVDEDFVESIRVKGILQPVLLSNRLKDNKHVIIAGHRRVEGSRVAGLNEVPCIIKSYDNIDDEVADLVVSNKQRTKNNHQKKQEFFIWNQILCQIKQVRKELSTSEVPDFENMDFRTGVRNYEEMLKSDNIDSRKAVAELMGLSEREVKYLTCVYLDDYKNKQVSLISDKLEEKGVNVKLNETICDKLYKYFNDIRKLCDSQEMTLKQGYEAIQEELKNSVNIKEKKKKEVPEETTKVEVKPIFNLKNLLKGKALPQDAKGIWQGEGVTIWGYGESLYVGLVNKEAAYILNIEELKKLL